MKLLRLKLGEISVVSRPVSCCIFWGWDRNEADDFAPLYVFAGPNGGGEIRILKITSRYIAKGTCNE